MSAKSVEFVDWCIICLVIKAQNDWHDVERLHVAMCCICHIF